MREYQLITEGYVNAVGFGNTAIATKERYRDIVWDMLQKSYEKIGGIKGSGFNSPQEMVEKIPMWKIAVRDDEVRAVILYKDKHGRKSVAVATDGSAAGAWFMRDMFKNEIRRSYGEKSKAALGLLMKTVPWDTLQPFVVSPDRVAELSPGIVAISGVPKEEWPDDAAITLSRYPMLVDYGYLREIGSSLVFKIMIGSPGKSIQ
jgi:hypothetical protein